MLDEQVASAWRCPWRLLRITMMHPHANAFMGTIRVVNTPNNLGVDGSVPLSVGTVACLSLKYC